MRQFSPLCIRKTIASVGTLLAFDPSVIHTCEPSPEGVRMYRRTINTIVRGCEPERQQKAAEQLDQIHHDRFPIDDDDFMAPAMQLTEQNK